MTPTYYKQTDYDCHVLAVYLFELCVYVCVCMFSSVSYWYMSMVVHVCVVVYM